MNSIALDILTDLVLEDVIHDGQLFEMNPYHDAQGRFTSKGATELYTSGALAFGRAKGLKAKAQGLDREGIRAAIKAGIEQHLNAAGDREAGQARLTLIRSKIAKGNLPPAPQPKEAKVREPRAPNEKASPGAVQQVMTMVKQQHAAALKLADAAAKKIEKREGDQVQARKEWNDAMQKATEARGQLEGIMKALQGKGRGEQRPPEKAGSPRVPKEEQAPAKAPAKNYAIMDVKALKAELKAHEGEHAKAAAEHRKAQETQRASGPPVPKSAKPKVTGQGLHYEAMRDATERMTKAEGQIAKIQAELKRRGA